jgi:hypothetical protein
MLNVVAEDDSAGSPDGERFYHMSFASNRFGWQNKADRFCATRLRCGEAVYIILQRLSKWRNAQSLLRLSKISPHKPAIIRDISFTQGDKLSCASE